jgi:16S rRNA (adenine1518-N6/adenine1519-N6)-dimethyltransferase
VELRPPLKKSLGQHLLKDKNLLRKMVRLAGVGREDRVLEIGPGHGDLTRCIAEAARSVVAVELDRRVREILESVERDFPHVRFIFADILDVDLAVFSEGTPLTVMGNIPYNVTGEILFKLLASRAFVKGAYLTMQKEVAERLVSSSHARSYGALSVIFQLAARVKLLILLKPGLFVPPPKVDSAFISIVFREETAVDEGLVRFIKTCFRHKRKVLRHSLEGNLGADDIGRLYDHMAFSDKVRAEEIEPEGFERMYRFLYSREVQ